MYASHVEERLTYPGCVELQRLFEATKLALRALGREGGEAPSRRVVEYVAAVSEAAQGELRSLKSGGMPPSLARHLGRVERPR